LSVTFQLQKESTSKYFKLLSTLFGAFKKFEFTKNSSGKSSLGNNHDISETAIVLTHKGLGQDSTFLSL